MVPAYKRRRGLPALRAPERSTGGREAPLQGKRLPKGHPIHGQSAHAVLSGMCGESDPSLEQAVKQGQASGIYNP